MFKTILLTFLLLITSCNDSTVTSSEQTEPSPKSEKSYSFEWNNKEWDAQLVKSLKASRLSSVVAKDAKDFGYKTGMDLIEFYGKILVKIAYYESKFIPSKKYQEAFVGRDGKRIYSRGLFQLSLGSSRGYPKCQMKTEANFHIGVMNINCAVAILEKWVVNDGVLTGKVTPPVGASKWDKGWRGGARYWAVMRWTRAYTIKSLAAIKAANK